MSEKAFDLYLRRASEADCRLLFDWRNDPEVRKNSFHKEEIPWESHKAWFERLLRDKNRIQYILMAGDTDKTGLFESAVPAGQVRIDIAEDVIEAVQKNSRDIRESESQKSPGDNRNARSQLSSCTEETKGSREKPCEKTYAAEISYSIGAGFRGRGFGSEAIRLVTEKTVSACPHVGMLTAKVLPENAASIKVFQKNGFTCVTRKEDFLEFQKCIKSTAK